MRFPIELLELSDYIYHRVMRTILLMLVTLILTVIGLLAWHFFFETTKGCL